MEALLNQLIADVKSLHKDVRKIKQKLEDPTGEKAEARSKNNGFRKPLDVDDKLRAFLGLAADAKISRAEVTQAIDAYAVKHGLKAGQVINMDDKLRDLLQPPPDAQVTYLKLQKYLAPHYIKDTPPPTPAVTEAVPAAPKKPRVAKKA